MKKKKLFVTNLATVLTDMEYLRNNFGRQSRIHGNVLV